MLNQSDLAANSASLLPLIHPVDLDDGAMLYSLIDGAKFPALGRLKLPGDGSVTLHSLLGESAQVDAFFCGPILLSHARRQHCPVLIKLLNEMNSAHFLSLIVSSLPLPDLFTRLRWLTDVVHDDGTEWVMRYYDPRVLPHWLDVLNAKQRAVALGGIRSWAYVDMRARPQIVGGAGGEAGIDVTSDPMQLSQHQCDQLMDKTLPYMVMHQLENDDPQVLDNLLPHDRYEFFSLQLRKANTYGLSSPTDLKCFCMLAIMLGMHFDALPLCAKALQETNLEQSFSERILAWTPAQWATLEEDAVSIL